MASPPGPPLGSRSSTQPAVAPTILLGAVPHRLVELALRQGSAIKTRRAPSWVTDLPAPLTSAAPGAQRINSSASTYAIFGGTAFPTSETSSFRVIGASSPNENQLGKNWRRAPSRGVRVLRS